MVYEAIKKLVTYGMETGLISEEEKIYSTNLILDVLKLDDYEEPEENYEKVELEPVLKELLDYAVEKGLIEDSVVYRDLFDTRLMNCLVPRPSQVIKTFKEKYAASPEEATNYYYKLSRDSDYIRRYRVCKDMKWVTKTEYGDIDITINLSKPEKDPRRLPPQSLPSRAVIRSASSAARMRGTQAAPIIRQGKTTELYL